MGLKKLYKKLNSLRWRLGISFALLALTVTALLTGIAVHTAATISLSAQRQKASSAALGAATAFADSLTRSSMDPAQAAKQLGLAAGGRILWLGPDNIVRVDGAGDSGLNGKTIDLPKTLLNDEVPRSEIFKAGNRWVVYATVPLKISNRPVGRILLTSDLEAVRWEIIELRRRLWLTGAALALVFSLMGFVVAQSLSKPLENITKAVSHMKEGRLNQKVSVEGSGEMESLAEGFNEMAAQVAALDEQRRAFVADAAHELRTPLAALRVLAEGIRGEDKKGFIRQIDRLTQLVNNLLTLARLDNPQLKTNLMSIRVKDLIDEVIWSLKPLVLKKNINVNVKLYGKEAWVIGDPDWLHQALVNILDNSIRYTPLGGNIDLSVNVEKGLTHITVEDTGPGVPREVLSKLGTRFYRPSSSRQRRTGGSGLGLSIVQQIVNMHHGSVFFDCSSGKGLIVTITLPEALPES